MSSWQDMTLADLEGIMSAFAAPVSINGTEILAVVDDEGQGSDESREGVNVQVQTLLVKSADMARPKNGRVLELNGKEWIVSKSMDREGLLEIQIYREVS